jgi:hypothetical protein
MSQLQQRSRQHYHNAGVLSVVHLKLTEHSFEAFEFAYADRCSEIDANSTTLITYHHRSYYTTWYWFWGSTFYISTASCVTIDCVVNASYCSKH